VENAFFTINNLEPQFLEENKKVILYAGNFYGERKLNYLFEPIKQLSEDGIIENQSLKIHVFGKITDEDKEYSVKLNLQDLIKEHNTVSTKEILKYMKGSDILYLPQGDDVNYSIPYKFFDYLSVQKPILAVTPSDSATAQIINETGSGESADISDSKSIFNALKKILCNNRQYSFNSGKYTWENISSRYIEVLKSL
jgi:glycosyltransferase involved in cell wall biosynthesis